MSHDARELKPADLGRRMVDTMSKLQALQLSLREDDALAVMSQSGLTIAQLVALHVLVMHGVHTVGGIASCVKLSAAATSHLVDRLVQRGLVARIEHAVDRRQKQVSISPTGRALMERLERARMAGITGLLAQLSPELRGRLVVVLGELMAELEPQLAARRAARASKSGAPRQRPSQTTRAGAGRSTHKAARRKDSRGQAEERA
jgi:MarR family transcriptional regulator, organic hydroperoxide resistance regulator